ncbi:hypothetical protein GCM10011607_19770 [Shewanella inventionis]|uniref:Uncharacterized protein n=1 Tax=Shewanella inventionis TaxID=1738770 RepID=A0ABQ1J3G1_9GAMM|nr:hypothetical protein GCM10011607_19770 [Shewanella inventionis]
MFILQPIRLQAVKQRNTNRKNTMQSLQLQTDAKIAEGRQKNPVFMQKVDEIIAQ